jgi:hypothetical protein
MLASCFTQPLPKPAFCKQCGAMGMIRIGLGNGFGTLGNCLGIGIWNGHGNGFGIGTGQGIGNAVRKQID